MLSSVEYRKCFITSGPELFLIVITKFVDYNDMYSRYMSTHPSCLASFPKIDNIHVFQLVFLDD